MNNVANGRLCCKSRFALVAENSAGRRCDFRVKMWGASSPHVKLTGDLANVSDAINRRLFAVCNFAKNVALQVSTFTTISANNDQGAVQQIAAYSITSSAIASTLAGISRPSAFAILRLMTRLNLVGCITGKSAGRSPLRMRPV